MIVLVKQPAETLQQLVSFPAPVVAPGTIAGVARGLVPGATPIGLPGAAVTAAGGLLVDIAGGADGERYLITVTASAADGRVFETEIEVAVIDAAWTMPDGGVAYLSIADFVRRFGLPEIIVMTDGDGSGRIDRDYLIGALQAAQGQADLNLGARYAVPLTIVPEAIKTAIADLARGRLYPRGAPEGVALLVKSAERTLERIASGALVLPLATGEVAAPAASPTPVLISDRGRRAYPHGLGDAL